VERHRQTIMVVACGIADVQQRRRRGEDAPLQYCSGGDDSCLDAGEIGF
jgi:hypothetical protein